MTNAYILQRNRITTKTLYTARASHYEHYPLVKGNMAPSFSLSLEESLVTNSKAGLHVKEQFVSLDDLLLEQKPLVIIFYTPGIQKAANLLFFESLNKSVSAKGGRLLIITSLQHVVINKHNPALDKLDIFKDSRNAIAKAFGLYDPQNLLWNWVPGIEESETFLPALYLIAPDKQIAYHHVDYNFSLFNEPELMHNSFVQHLLESVEAFADTRTYYPVSYKLVS
jgi:AhpC/TSA family